MGFDPGLRIGEVVSNEKIISIFKCGNMGGMRRSHTTNTLVLVSDYTKGIYHDKWEWDILHYTGMGKKGDQNIDASQNRTLNESDTNGVELFLFEVFKKKEYTYKGQVELAELPYQEDQLDEDGKMRKVWVFPLTLKENNGTKYRELIEKVAEEASIMGEGKEISETEQLSLIKSRVGHGALKKALLQKENKCKICGLQDERFLIASHIKPWRESTAQERLDINNVFLLCPHHDAAFDKGYITFDDEGKLCISSELSLETRALLNLEEGKRIDINSKIKEYMEWHKKYIFKC